MGVTYTSAEVGATRRAGLRSRVTTSHVAVALVAVVSVGLLALTYAGRLAAFDAGEAGRQGPPPLDLTARPTLDDLDPALARAFADPHDRRLAAATVLQAVTSGARPQPLANVGVLGSLTIAASAIDRTRGLDVFAERLAAARERAKAAHAPPPTSLPLFTASELGAVKPAFSVRTRGEHLRAVVWCVLALATVFPLIAITWRWRGVTGDSVLLSAVALLVTLGAVAMLSRPDPLRDSLLLVRYTQGVVLGALLFLAVSLARPSRLPFVQWPYLSLGAALLLALVLVLFGSGPGTSGAKVNLGPMQPVELIRLLLIFFLAGYLGARWELIRQIRETGWRGRTLPAWLHVPRLDHLLPVLGGVTLALLLFFVLRDLGPALLISLTFLALLSVARAGIGALVIGGLVLAAGFAAGYHLEISNTLTARVAMWQSPWDNAVRGGDQVAQAVWSLAAGAWSGTGLGLGDARFLPAGHTDLVLAAIGEELGLAGTLAIGACMGVVVWRGLRLAQRARSDAHFFLGVALTLSLVLPALVMSAGAIGLIPLTGIVTPFVSYGGSAMIANFIAIGLLVAIGRDGNAAAADLRPFAGPIRALVAGLTTCAAVVGVGWARVQAVSADELLVKPQLSLQADGGRRYQYNPRVLDALRTLPRGTIFDRRGVPLAGDVATVAAHTSTLDRLRVSLRDACPDSSLRCYPLGGRTYHLVGDANTRTNWSATNTSFVERDAESQLRGFDDHAETVRTGDGPLDAPALRRDYRELIPLVRYRWEPDHEDVKAIRDRTRDVHLTVDAGLQAALTTLVARSLGTTRSTKAAVVVVDVASGDVLASVSYPFPAVPTGRQGQVADALFDRARYGLYPPGSTFKLVTAAAALSLDPEWHRLQLTCTRLPDGRAGVRIPGWGRPIRDDVLDKHPHGTETMREGLVHSCNAYFAQLAVRLGVQPLAAMAEAAGLSYATAPAARARETLPHAGFGQGDVLATPLRMARVAAAIASDGQLREPGLVRGPAAPAPRSFMTETSARLLASDMRAVVMEGTGRLLARHPQRIAGKTGTAELDDAPSHAWFVGFAPAAAASRRIAFAVLIENAGYGGSSAASLAGQVVSVAAGLGLAE